MKWIKLYKESEDTTSNDEVLSLLNQIKDNDNARIIKKDIEKIIFKYSSEKQFRDSHFDKPREYMKNIKELMRDDEISQESDYFFDDVRNSDWVYSYADSCESKAIDELASIFEQKFPDYVVKYDSIDIDREEWGYISLTKKSN